MGNEETVIIVHGTWAHSVEELRPDEASWWARCKDTILGWTRTKPPESKPSDQRGAALGNTDQVRWYKIPPDPDKQPNFVSKLNQALEEAGSAARCWAHCKDNSQIFSWRETTFGLIAPSLRRT
jgi:hypothetical protein